MGRFDSITSRTYEESYSEYCQECGLFHQHTHHIHEDILDVDEPHVLFKEIYAEPFDDHPAFHDFLEYWNPTTLCEFCSCHDVYQSFMAIESNRPAISPIEMMKDISFKSHPFIDLISSETRGIILYADQIESLISYTIGDPQKASQWRKAFNRKDVKYLNKMAVTQFDDGRDLLEVVKERVVLEHIRWQSWKEASGIWNLLCTNN